MNIIILYKVRERNENFNGFNAKSGKVKGKDHMLDANDPNFVNSMQGPDGEDVTRVKISTAAKLMRTNQKDINEQSDRQRQEAGNHLTRMHLLVTTSLVFRCNAEDLW